MKELSLSKKFLFIALFSVAILWGLTGKVNAAYATDENGIQWNVTFSGTEATKVFYNAGTIADGKLVIPSTLTYSGKEYTVKSIGGRGNYSSICSVAGVTEVVIPDTVTTILNGTFYNMNIKKIDLPEGLLSIGNYAFNSSKIEEIKFPSKLTSIGSYAFANCSELSGDLIIPDSVTSISNNAFYNDPKFDGILKVGNGVSYINSNTFWESFGFKKIMLGTGITKISYNNFKDLKELWIAAPKGQVYFESGYCQGETPYVHFGNEVHTIIIGSLPGVKVINTITGEEITSGDYECGAYLKYKIEVAPGYNYPNLKVVEIIDNNTDDYKFEKVESGKEYEISEILRDRKILIQDISDGADLALRTFITDVNRVSVSKPRVPEVQFGANGIEYRHTKNPLKVSTGDNVAYKIRVYNESGVTTTCGEVAVHIPDGMSLVKGNVSNEKYGWKLENGVYKSTYLADKKIGLNMGNGILKYKDIEIVLRVDESSCEDDVLKTVFAEISGASEKDTDSTPGNVKVVNGYKKDEIYNSNSSTYIRSEEDDEDFDTIVLNSKIKVEYNIKLKKIDSKTKESLRGAQFNLLSSGKNTFGFRRTDANGKEFIDIREINDGEVIATATSDENGVVDFGGLMTFGEGSDSYTYEEVHAPIGYLTNIGRKTKVRVDKKILDVEKGTYSVKVYCEASAATVDTESYEFTPVTNAEQLQKIGSGDNVVIDGITYEYNMDTNYKLMNDIDLAGIEWKPINNELKCIIDGNGHKIKNLKITATEDMKIAEVGFVRVFSGIVKNLTFENPIIKIEKISDTAESLTGVQGVGTFAGVMKQGYIDNCKVIGDSAKIEATSDNVGGFVGHTLEEGILTITNSKNYATVRANSYENDKKLILCGKNVGGFVGCSKSSLEVTNTTNYGTISAARFNAGGIVGFTSSSDYANMEVMVGYDEDNKTIDFLVENTRTEGDYNLTLEIRDQKSGVLVGGATYEIDKVDDKIQTALLDTGSLKLFDKVIHYSGRDIYFLTEDANISGYEKLNGIIKVEIERYWDFDDLTYKARANAELVSHKDYEQYAGTREEDVRVDNGEEFDKGQIFTDVNIANVNWNTRKIEFDNVVNEGTISTEYMNSAGLIGVSYSIVDIKNCTNKGIITGPGKVAGLVAEIRTVDGKETDATTGSSVVIKTENTTEYSKFTKCENANNVAATLSTWLSGYGSVGGIVADCKGNIRAENCVNNAVVTSDGQRQVGGIIGQITGSSIIDSCTNNSEVSSVLTNYSMGNGYHQNVVGGIVGQVMVHESAFESMLWESVTTDISNCKNYGAISSIGKLGGIVGQTYGNVTNIKDCEVKGLEENKKLELSTLSQGENGGIIGFTCSPYVNLANNKVENVKLENKSMAFGYTTTSSTMGGIVAGINGPSYAGASYYCLKNYRNIDVKSVDINNNKVLSCDLTNRGKEIGGIFGLGIYIDKSHVKISDCLVESTNMLEINPDNGTYSEVGGITAGGNSLGDMDILYCTFKNSKAEIEGVDGNRGIGESTASGIFASCQNFYGNLTVSDCNVTGSLIRTYTRLDTSGDTAGVIGYLGSIYGNVKMLRTTIEKSTVTTYTENVAGMLGAVCYCYGDDGVLIDECNSIETNVIRSCPNPEGIGTTYDKVGGIASYFYSISNGVKIKNCNVIGKDTTNESERTIISTYYGGIGGVYADDNGCNFVEISDTTVKNIDMKMYGTKDINGCSYADLGGINAVGQTKLKLKNVFVEDSNVIAGYAKNVGGMIGWRCTDAELDNCDVKNVKVANHIGLDEHNQKGWGTYGNAGGIACTFGGKTILKNCDITDITVESGAIGAGGAIYFSNGELNVNDCTVTNVKIIDNWENVQGETRESVGSGYQDYRPFGGFVANVGNSTWFNNVKVKNMECTGAKYAHIGGIFGYVSNIKQLTNCEVDGGKFESSRCVNTTNGAVGGMGADLCYLDGKCENNVVKNVDMSMGVHLVGGLFGYFSGYNQEIKNCSVENVNVTHRNENYWTGGNPSDSLPSAGGLIGETNSSMKFTGCTVKDSTVTAKGTSGRPLQVGGIAGGIWSTSTISDCKVINTKLTNEAPNSYTGGLFGYTYDDPDTNYIVPITVNNCSVEQGCEIKGIGHLGGAVGQATLIGTDIKVSDAKIECNNSGSSQFGGLMAIGQPSSVLKNITVKDTTLTEKNEEIASTYIHAGGISGVFKGTIEGATVTNVNVTAKGSVGGVAGISEGASIKNATVTGGTLISKLSTAGGLSGVNKSSVENCKVINTNITAQDCAGGLVAISDGALTSDTVKGATVISKAHHAGGLVACTTQNIDSCSVTDTTVKLETLNDSNCVGGIVGTGLETLPTITNVTANNNTLTGGVLFGETWVNNGKYVGAPTAINDNLVNTEINAVFNSKPEQEQVIEVVDEAKEESNEPKEVPVPETTEVPVVEEKVVEENKVVETEKEEVEVKENVVENKEEQKVEETVKTEEPKAEEKISEEVKEEVIEAPKAEITEKEEEAEIVTEEPEKTAENETTEETTTEM